MFGICHAKDDDTSPELAALTIADLYVSCRSRRAEARSVGRTSVGVARESPATFRLALPGFASRPSTGGGLAQQRNDSVRRISKSACRPWLPHLNNTERSTTFPIGVDPTSSPHRHSGRTYVQLGGRVAASRRLAQRLSTVAAPGEAAYGGRPSERHAHTSASCVRAADPGGWILGMHALAGSSSRRLLWQPT